MSNKMHIKLNVNGKDEEFLAEPRELLIYTLRERLNITGPHIGCETSHCGACTVTIDGKSVKSCTMFAAQANGKSVTTIEGIGGPDNLHPLQEAFKEHHGLQCGYCTPGMLMAAKALLDRNPNPSREEVIDAISGNLCRCTDYEPIVEAILAAAKAPRRTA